MEVSGQFRALAAVTGEETNSCPYQNSNTRPSSLWRVAIWLRCAWCQRRSVKDNNKLIPVQTNKIIIYLIGYKFRPSDRHQAIHT